jgi:DNA repair exonuclease SbcCD ATPase subunit
LVAYHSEASTEPISVEFLSGSQRFRVALSLALGLGQYASQGRGSLKSAFFDEGFGSLDPDGREQMVDEFYSLKETLDCVVIVSHQEEIARAFPDRYDVSIEGRTSKVVLCS